MTACHTIIFIQSQTFLVPSCCPKHLTWGVWGACGTTPQDVLGECQCSAQSSSCRRQSGSQACAMQSNTQCDMILMYVCVCLTLRRSCPSHGTHMRAAAAQSRQPWSGRKTQRLKIEAGVCALTQLSLSLNSVCSDRMDIQWWACHYCRKDRKDLGNRKKENGSPKYNDYVFLYSVPGHW